MSDALQDAEALYELLGKSENYVTVKDVLKGAIEEIKRLREQISRLGRLAFFAKDEPVEKIINHFVQWGDSTFKYLQELKGQLAAKDDEIKRLQEQLARWQQTAISERARRIEAGLKLANIDGESWDDRMARARVLAAKGLGLEQDASYIGRLETAYLLAKEESLWANHDVDDIVNSKQRAQAALAKIREGTCQK